MKITASFLSIPPYISVPWDEVAALQTSEKDGNFILFVTLKNDTIVEIPNLSQPIINTIFDAHAKSLQPTFPMPFGFSIPVNGDSPITAFGDGMEHNPDQKDFPNLPPQLLEKLTVILKSLGVDTGNTLPQPEAGCNCVHCQIVKSLGAPAEEPVAIEDLSFRDWEVTQLEGPLYKVTNPLDKNEHYEVFLGTPLGCTCGHNDCEHIKAALHT